MHEFCEVGTYNYDCFNWKQTLDKEMIPIKKYAKQLKIWHLLKVLFQEPSGESAMTKSSIMDIGMSLRSRTAFGMG